jgi:hypothetical protein
MVTIALAGLAFAIWNQVFTLMEFQVFPVFLFPHFNPNYPEGSRPIAALSFILPAVAWHCPEVVDWKRLAASECR